MCALEGKHWCLRFECAGLLALLACLCQACAQSLTCLVCVFLHCCDALVSCGASVSVQDVAVSCVGALRNLARSLAVSRAVMSSRGLHVMLHCMDAFPSSTSVTAVCCSALQALSQHEGLLTDAGCGRMILRVLVAMDHHTTSPQVGAFIAVAMHSTL